MGLEKGERGRRDTYQIGKKAGATFSTIGIPLTITAFPPTKKGKIEIHSYSTRGKPHGDRYSPPPSSFAAGGERSAAAVEKDAFLNISLGEFKLGWPGEKRHKPHFEGATHARNRLR